ncbi:MAG: hypothetical protein QOD10_991, partial [Mycobacterium sp.]|nr:hypothetical protein [Mycobacterium sp.]
GDAAVLEVDHLGGGVGVGVLGPRVGNP